MDNYENANEIQPQQRLKMKNALSRRSFHSCSAAVAAANLLLPAQQAFAQNPRRLTAGTRSIDVNGRSASVFGITDDRGRPGLILEPDEPFNLSLENQSGTPTIIHWHGQVPPPELDGVTDTGYVSPIEDGTAATYNFTPRSGTHWMHSHQGLQEQALMAAPLIVQSKGDVSADLQEVVVLLHDFSFRSPEEILQGLGGGMGHGAMDPMQPAAPMAGMVMGNSAMAMGNMDLNDIQYDAFLANDRTLDDPEIIRTERGGRVRLRIINGGASTAFWLDFGGVTASVIAVDGNPVRAVDGTRFPLAIAQRIDLIVEVPAGATVPVFAVREGDRARTGLLLAAPGAAASRVGSLADTPAAPLDMSFEKRLSALSSLAPRAADVQHSVMLTGSMSPYLWTIDDQPWNTRRKLEIKRGQRVELEFMNHTMMAHPMHLHGHHFQVIKIEGEPLSGAMRDTVLVPSMGSVTVAFDADNPGRWLYHCHNLYHMAAGMMSEVIYI
jgi:FtsP/CotA-like multicopper oxidase with cupredoxin domain